MIALSVFLLPRLAQHFERAKIRDAIRRTDSDIISGTESGVDLVKYHQVGKLYTLLESMGFERTGTYDFEVEHGRPRRGGITYSRGSEKVNVSENRARMYEITYGSQSRELE